ncbi:alanine racemase C-terminal domain-containing protein [Clostridium kluyveri]|nr:alanine racemase C-terminal domain-containing protein [Clostridium kluyveri]
MLLKIAFSDTTQLSSISIVPSLAITITPYMTLVFLSVLTSPHIATLDTIKALVSIKARISAVKTLFAGEAVGYGLAFTAPHNMRIAVLTIGYADDILRCLSCGIGHVLINGQKAPVVGRICMDQMMVDITGIEGIRQGDIAVIIASPAKPR